jgi:LysM repeat protein
MKPTKLLLVSILGLFFTTNNIFAQKNLPTTTRGGQIFYKYTLLKGESLESVAKKHSLKLADIYRSNPSARNGIKAGETILIPKSNQVQVAKKTTPNTAKTAKKGNTQRIYTSSQYNLTTHKVAKGETLFRISKKYKVSVNAIQQWNPRISNNRIIPGQELIVGIGKRRASKRNTMRKKIAMRNKRKKTKRTYRTASPTEKPIKHKVKKGEWLSVIAKKYKVSIADIKKWNDLKSDKIKVGDQLWIYGKGDNNSGPTGVTPNNSEPDPINIKRKNTNPDDNPIDRKYKNPNTNDKGKITHVVQRSETLYKISKKYKVSVAEIKKWNKITSGNYIKAGSTLVIYPKGYKTDNTGGNNNGNTGENKTPILKQPNPVKKPSGGDNPLDFNGTKDKYEVDGKVKVKYVVKSGDGLWKIAQAHKVKMEDIKDWNNLRNTDDLVVGQTLNIYTKYPPKTNEITKPGEIPKPTVNTGNPVKQSNDVFDLIRPGGTLPQSVPVKKQAPVKVTTKTTSYTPPTTTPVAKKVYKQAQPKNTVAKRVTTTPNTTTNKVYKQPATNLVKKKTFPPPPNITKKEPKPAAATTRPVMVIDNPTRTTKTEEDKVMVFEKGMASMIDVGQDSQKYQALHRTAPVGSFVRVTNLSNGKLVVVSVIGKLPANAPENVIIKLTKRAYDQLEANEKIPVEIDYDLDKN